MADATAFTQAVTVGEVARSLRDLGVRVVGDQSVAVTGLCQDSRQLLSGEIFAVRTGKYAAGATYVDTALALGASALLVEAGSVPRALPVPVIEVDNIERGIAFAAEAAFGFPSRELKLVGITGTNGKTTSAWLVQHALIGAGVPTARLGTLGFECQGVWVDASLTTPEADAVCRFERQALNASATHFVMEVSSHALLQNRVEGLTFGVAAFTNLTQDHLDFHPNMEAYFTAKARLFTDLSPEVSVIHSASAWGKRLVRLAQGRVLVVGTERDADVRLRQWQLKSRSLEATIDLPSGRVELCAPLSGQHNLENCLTALAIVEALKLDVQQAARALETVPQVPGRMERCDAPDDDIAVIVDYAHTPDALSRVLAAARGLGGGKLICVFGCGGDRDASKRRAMGESVRANADFAFITNDNPRSESPSLIASAIELAFSGHADQYSLVLDRAEAIETAISSAAAGDVVVVAGKGHETYQIVGAARLTFDDRVQAKAALERRRHGRRRN